MHMPSTGTAAFTITRDGLITAALKSLRVVAQGGTASANQLSDASVSLNIMLKAWATKGLKLWCFQQISIPMVVGKQTYTIGPTGADVTAVRPYRCFEYGNLIRSTIAGTSYDIPLRLISRSEYLQFGTKQSQGVPNSIYYHPGIDLAAGTTSPSTGYGTLYIYTTAVDTTRTIILNAQRPIYDMNAGTDEFDLPAEWFLACKYNLMATLADDYEVPENRLTRIFQLAEKHLEDVVDFSVEEASTTFAPDLTGMRR
jgi:hypothetical protein